MVRNVIRLLGIGVVSLCATLAAADSIVQDDATGFSREEFEQVVKHWPEDMRAAAANDAAVRRELVTLALATKKIALDAQAVTKEQDAEFYWTRELKVQELLRGLMVRRYLDTIVVPDLEPLARERYAADKDRYALEPGRRLSSHILFRCVPGDCDVEQVNKTAREVLDALRNGASFEEMVQAHSDDAGTKAKGGEFRWLKQGEPHVVKEYTEAVFALDKVGDYSEPVSTIYGLHIIRLDGIEPEQYKSFDDVRDHMIRELDVEYRRLAAMEFDKRYQPAGELRLDDTAIEEVLGPYRDKDPADGAAVTESAPPAAAEDQPAAN